MRAALLLTPATIAPRIAAKPPPLSQPRRARAQNLLRRSPPYFVRRIFPLPSLTRCHRYHPVLSQTFPFSLRRTSLEIKPATELQHHPRYGRTSQRRGRGRAGLSALRALTVAALCTPPSRQPPPPKLPSPSLQIRRLIRIGPC